MALYHTRSIVNITWSLVRHVSTVNREIQYYMVRHVRTVKREYYMVRHVISFRVWTYFRSLLMI